MKAEMNYLSGFCFETKIRDHVLNMDTQVAAGGTNKGPSPKELLLGSIIGCTGMDIVSLLRKYQMEPASLKIFADAEPRSTHPRIFTEIMIQFEVTDDKVSPERLKEAVHLSLTRYCGVSAMVFKTVPIKYKIQLNGSNIGVGEAAFEL